MSKPKKQKQPPLEISPVEALRRLREVFPAAQGYNVTVGGELCSYARDPEIWGADTSGGLRYEVNVWRGEWHFGTNHLQMVTGCYEYHQSLREAVEAVLRVVPYVPPVADERPLFVFEQGSEVAA